MHRSHVQNVPKTDYRAVIP